MGLIQHEVDGATLFNHMRAPWKEGISWYKGPKERPYSRRELWADFIVHVIGLILGVIAFVALIFEIRRTRPVPIPTKKQVGSHVGST